MKGYRTVAGMGVAGLAAILTLLGIEVTEQDQGAIIAAITALYGIWMRFQTNTKFGESTPPGEIK